MSAASRSGGERAQAQRENILDAAQACFIRFGFHAAGMAKIAETAGISPGLIYRYFDSKEAIILAIIERQLAEKRGNIAALQTRDQLAARIGDLFQRWQRRDEGVMNAALMLEMSAEATRDARIAAAVAAADGESRARFRAWLEAQARAQGIEPDPADIDARMLTLGAFIDGLSVRAARDPDLDPARVAAAVERLVPGLLDFRVA